MITGETKSVCPACKSEIETLDAVMHPTVICAYNGVGYNLKNLNSDIQDFDMKDSLSHFCCPECGEEIAETENEANLILHI